MKMTAEGAGAQVKRLSDPDQKYIYVIGMADGPQKVGLATDPDNRLATLQAGNAGLLVLAAKVPVPASEAPAIETCAHHRLLDDWLRGEWFNITPAQAAAAIDWAIAEVQGGRWPPHKLAKVARIKKDGNIPPPRNNKFGAWRLRMGISRTVAAVALGRSRRQVYDYETGADELPRYVWLATIALEDHPELIYIRQLRSGNAMAHDPQMINGRAESTLPIACCSLNKDV